jgi:hypothetical protein
LCFTDAGAFDYDQATARRRADREQHAFVACPTVRGYEFDLSTFSDVDPPLGGIGVGRSGGGGGLYLDLASDTPRNKSRRRSIGSGIGGSGSQPCSYRSLVGYR